MAILSRIIILLSIILSMNSYAAVSKKQVFHRSFWHPMYHGERLNYCSLDGKKCGLELATVYCRMMGYQRADHAIKDNNIGLTHYLVTTMSCKGWQCSGFKTIRCVGDISHNPAEPYHYRYRRYVVPRYNNYRVAWCYDGEHGCGRRAAYSFCRRMGYLNVKKYQIQKCVAATQAIGNQKLCFGPACHAFAEIDCYR
ncbi:hypothetical protein Lbir_2567 [Legionella birminghamensis]|uniref:Uncharacterized protein n=1 Tax=Legionella birminghamensis TaxID=28083 RepID=A0A378I920_9GAMM|nr:hypothetical protein [Legionella birminghamensis]KTC67965.1 hypothetical protein Lbir_2567 [Legionella birminghamensis]STX31326.1 Uncharacterised protein [Legionella birminghamensis]